MRHSRRAVMTERYKLYAKKNIFNSRYFVRNLQIGLLSVALLVVAIGIVAFTYSVSKDDEAVVATNAKVSVKDALFSNSQEQNTLTKVETTENTTEVYESATETTETANIAISETVKDELNEAVTEVANTVSEVVEEKKQMVAEEPESEFENKCIANVDETLNIRKDPSVEAEFVGSMNLGAIAIVEGVEGEWTKIKSGDVEGYVLSEYVLTGASAEEFAKNHVTLRGTVLEDGVNIRSEKSTEATILTVMDEGDTISVLECQEDVSEVEELKTEKAKDEDASDDSYVVQITTASELEGAVQGESEKVEQETDDIEWITVMLEDGQTGYVSADLVDVEELYEIAVSAEELQRRAEEEAARRAAEEEAARRAAEEAAAKRAAEAAAQQSDNSSNDSYKGETTEPTTTTEQGELIGTFTITAYCGCSKCSGGHNKTASGTTPTEGRTIAADTSILPFGTQVVIDGIVYTVEDSGSGVKGNHIDIFFATHEKAIAFGKKTINVYRY